MAWWKLVAFAVVLVGISTAYAQGYPEGGSASVRSRDQRPTDAVQVGKPVQIVAPDVPVGLRDKILTSVFSATLISIGTFTDVAFAGGDPELKDNGLDAISQWRYTPCTRAGVPVDCNVYVLISSNRGNVSTSVEIEPPYPTEPHKSTEEQISMGALYRVAPSEIEAPRAIYAPDPEFPELARKAKFQGTVRMGVIVGVDGTVTDVWVTKKGGLGLDQKSVETVRRWKFQPGMKSGVPVPVLVTIETSFHLY